MANEPKRGGDVDPPRAIVREVLEQLLQKYITPLTERLEELVQSLKSDDARELVNLREALRSCEDDNKALGYENAQLQTRANMYEEARDSWKVRHDSRVKELDEARLEIAFLRSRVDNLEDGAHD